MPTYTDVFGGDNIFPSELSFLSLVLTANVTLQWPTEQAIEGQNVFADIMEVTPNAGLSITLPDARNASTGQATLINNIGANTVSILDNTGATIGTVASGVVKQFYLASNATQAGTWRVFTFGTGASSADAAALAGAGLKAITTTLNVKVAPTLTAVTPITLTAADRAEIIIWTGGVGVLNLPAPGTAGSDWFVYVRNSGTGTLTVTPPSGTINGAATKDFAAGDSAMIVTDGVNFFTLGFGTTISAFFDFTSINVAGAAGDYTLTGGELNRVSYRFTGALTGNRNIIVPTAIQQYWVDNETSGAFTLTVKTAAGTGVVVPQGNAMILSCDGSNVVSWEGAPGTGLIPTDLGGTGLATYAQGDLIYATAAQTLARLAKNVTATRYLANTGGSNAPNWDQVNLANGVTGDLPYANLTQGSALSVLGVTGNAVADVASITGVANQVLRVNGAGTVLAFGAIDLSQAAAVTGVLDETNGGTGQSTVSQGDLLYGSAANVWSKLAKDGAGFRGLFNTGTSNDPQWLLPRLAGNVLDNSSSNFQLSDGWRVKYHTSGTHTWTIPANATTAFDIGTVIFLDNQTGSLSIAPAATVTLNGHGQNLVGTGSISIPAGYKGILIKEQTDLWVLLTDAPVTSGQGVLYAGFGDGTGAGVTMTFNAAAAAWSGARTAQGRYTITHNLGLAAVTDLAITATARIGAGGTDDRFANVTNETANAFEIDITDVGTGLQDDDFYFHATRLV